jgi:hypothetical protein
MATDFMFRDKACRSLTNEIGVYVLCDLDATPIYVGQSKDGIRSRVRRHLTSARSDIIANRQIDVWEIAFVQAYPVATKVEITPLEDVLYHHFNDQSPLMNGTVPARPTSPIALPEPSQIVQVMSDVEIEEKLDPVQRLPRQAAHYTQLVDHFLNVKNSDEILRAIDAHFDRLQRYHKTLVKLQANN